MRTSVVFLLASCILLSIIRNSSGVELAIRPEWNAVRINFHLRNLTELMCKDTMYKLRMADRIQEDYKGTLAYELGLLASGIMDKFKHMLAIYRNYSSPTSFMNAEKSPLAYILMNAYHVIQSDYNEIRLERDMFLQIVEDAKKKEQKHKAMKKLMEDQNLDKEQLAQLQKMGFLGRRYMPNAKPQREKIMKKKGGNTHWAKVKDAAEADYKKKLRYIKWAEQWQNFNPEIEGVYIPDNLAKVGLANASNFLLKEFKGVV